MATKKWDIVKLFFKGPLHIGAGKGEYYEESKRVVHSDTLKAALHAVASEMDPKLADNNSFFESFNISSLFPFAKEEFFFPKPYTKLPLAIKGVKEGPDLSKKLKKITYLGKEVFEKVISGEDFEAEGAAVDPSGEFLFSMAGLSNVPVMTGAIQQRVTIPLMPHEHPVPFEVERIYFGEGCGLFFLVEMNSPEDKTIIENLLKVLGDQGIGTDRSVGNGHFCHQWDTLELELQEGHTHWMNLSLWCPQKEEIDNDVLSKSSYSLVKRGGYIAGSSLQEYRHFRKKSIYMFLEGSVFPGEKILKGKRIDLRPGDVKDLHPVWRDGRSIFLPIKVEEGS